MVMNIFFLLKRYKFKSRGSDLKNILNIPQRRGDLRRSLLEYTLELPISH
jgi:hypothetical protein